MKAVQTPSTKKRDYAAIAAKYVSDVMDGTIVSCKWVKLACGRQQKDLLKQSESGYPWTYEPAKGEKVCKFVEKCPHIKGPHAGKRLKLEPWQVWIVMTAFSWVGKPDQFIEYDGVPVNVAGKRRFRRVFLLLPRGNGKSFLVSAIALYMLTLDGEGGAEILCAATTREQAKVVWEIAWQMASKMPEFCERAGLTLAAQSINVLRTASYFRPVSAEAKSLEGANEHLGILDELHAHPNRKVFDAMESGLGKRDNSLLLIISTAGSDRSGVCHEVYVYVQKIVLERDADDRYFGCIWTIDDDDWSDPASHRKANPNYGVSVDIADISQHCHEAMQMASKQPNFLTKRLNVWVNSEHRWMDMRMWDKCADPSLDEKDFISKTTLLGLDLASKLDLLASMKIFWEDKPTDVKDKATGRMVSRIMRHYWVFGKYWTNQAQMLRTANASYEGWRLSGRLNVCPGNTNDYDEVENYIRDVARNHRLLMVAHDPYQAVTIVNHLTAEGIVMVEIKQITTSLSEPMKEVEAAVHDGRFHFDGDPILTWAIGNVVVEPDKNDNIFPRKQGDEDKIDPATALFTAINRVMTQIVDGGMGVTAFGNCSKCGELCIGTLKGEQLQYLCEKHG